MLIKFLDTSYQTALFSIIFVGLILVSMRKIKKENFFSKEVTNQLKGFAILAIVFSHIGYFLSSDPKFLYPLSILGGVAVNLFLFLSGFGLVLSALKSPLSPLQVYKKRLFKLFIPLWIVVSLVLLLDFFLLHRSYPSLEIVYSFLGFYPKADLFQNLDSPLWYFSLTLFYYLIFPLVFIKKTPLISPVLMLALSLLLLKLPLPVDPAILKLYKLHFLAFPLGMLFGVATQNLKFKLNKFLETLILTISVLVFLYTSIHSGVGQDLKIEQGISLITTLSLVTIFSFLKFDFRLFSLFGVYSYEIYLFHWPTLSRFNPFLGSPPFIMVVLSLILLTSLGYILQKITGKITESLRLA